MRIFITLAVAAISSVASLTAYAAERPTDFGLGRAPINASGVAPVTRSDFVKTGTNLFKPSALAVAPNWRYRLYRGEWWYWMPANYWTYYRNGNWLTYDPATYQSLVVTAPSYDPYYGDGYYGGYNYNRSYYGPGYSYYRYPGYRYGYYSYGYRPGYSYYRGPYRYGYGNGPYRYGYSPYYSRNPDVRAGARVGGAVAGRAGADVGARVGATVGRARR